MFEIGTANFSIAGFESPSKPFRQVVAEIAQCGYSHLFLYSSEDGPAVDQGGDAPTALVNVLKSDLDALLRTVSSQGLRISFIYPGFDLDHSSKGIDGTIDRLKAYRDLAWRLGCHTMIHSAGKAQAPNLPLENKKKQIEAVAQIMDALASDTPGEIFKMAVDIHYGAIIETVSDCKYLLEQVKRKNSGLCLNIGHLTTSGERGWELLENFPERIHTIAWKEHLEENNSAKPFKAIELGKGHTPFHKYIQVLRKTECKAPHLITIEDVPLDEMMGALSRSNQLLERMLSWKDLVEDIRITPIWQR